MSGLKNLQAILYWLWGVMAWYVNYSYEAPDDIEFALWPDWYWSQANAEKSDMAAPWNQYGDF